MTRTRMLTKLAVAPLALLFTLAGCGSDSGGSDSTASDDETHDKLLAYAQCLRDNGLNVEDPKPGEGVAIQNEGDPAKADAAMKACEHLAPPLPSDADKSAEREEMLEYAKCMRDNGVEKFADPKPGEGVHIGPDVAEDPDFEQAEKTCNELFGGDTNRHSTGGGA